MDSRRSGKPSGPVGIQEFFSTKGKLGMSPVTDLDPAVEMFDDSTKDVILEIDGLIRPDLLDGVDEDLPCRERSLLSGAFRGFDEIDRFGKPFGVSDLVFQDLYGYVFGHGLKSVHVDCNNPRTKLLPVQFA